MNKNDEIDDAFVSSRGAPFGKGIRLNIPTKNLVRVTLIIMGHLQNPLTLCCVRFPTSCSTAIRVSVRQLTVYLRDTSSNIYLVLRYRSWWPHRRSEERYLKKITEILDNQLKYRLFIYLFIHYIKQVGSTLSFFFVLSCRVMSYSVVFTLSYAFFVTDRNVACIDVAGVFVTLYFLQQNARMIICEQTQSFVQFLLKFSTVFFMVWNAKS